MSYNYKWVDYTKNPIHQFLQDLVKRWQYPYILVSILVWSIVCNNWKFVREKLEGIYSSQKFNPSKLFAISQSIYLSIHPSFYPSINQPINQYIYTNLSIKSTYQFMNGCSYYQYFYLDKLLEGYIYIYSIYQSFNKINISIYEWMYLLSMFLFGQTTRGLGILLNVHSLLQNYSKEFGKTSYPVS